MEVVPSGELYISPAASECPPDAPAFLHGRELLWNAEKRIEFPGATRSILTLGQETGKGSGPVIPLPEGRGMTGLSKGKLAPAWHHSRGRLARVLGGPWHLWPYSFATYAAHDM